MTSTEVTAAFSAAAAVAACAAVITDIWRGKKSRLPELIVMTTNTGTGQLAGFLAVAVRNVGLGPAIAVGFAGVHEGESFSGMMASVLGPGEEKTVYTSVRAPTRGTIVAAFVSCRALDGRLHWWTADERHFSARVGGSWFARVIHRGRLFACWPIAAEMFSLAYPDVDIPPDAVRDGAPGGAHPSDSA